MNRIERSNSATVYRSNGNAALRQHTLPQQEQRTHQEPVRGGQKKPQARRDYSMRVYAVLTIAVLAICAITFLLSSFAVAQSNYELNKVKAEVKTHQQTIEKLTGEINGMNDTTSIVKRALESGMHISDD